MSEYESVLLMLSKRQAGVSAEIRTGRLTDILKQDIVRHNAQYPPILLAETKNIHDCFLIVDVKTSERNSSPFRRLIYPKTCYYETPTPVSVRAEHIPMHLRSEPLMGVDVYDKLYRGTKVYSPNSSMMRVMPA